MEEIKERIRGGWRVWAARARDRFGDYGLIGVCMVEPAGSEWRIDNFLFSCRVLGRGLEKTFLAFVLEQGSRSGAAAVNAEFIPTTKNKLCERFYPENGFSLREQAGNACRYQYALESYAAAYPEFVTLHLS